MGNLSEEEIDLMHAEKAKSMVPVLVILAIFMLIGLVGNILVVFFYGFKTRRTTNSIFICTLALYDSLSFSVGVPLHLYDLRNLYTYDYGAACKTMWFVNHLTALGSAFTLLIIAIDRYKRICHPFKKQFTIRQAKIVCGLFCLLAACLAWPAWVLYSAVDLPLKYKDAIITISDCTSIRTASYKIYIRVYSSLLLSWFIITMILLSVIYTLIWRVIWKNKVTRQTYSQRQPASDITSELSEVSGIPSKPNGDTLNISTTGINEFPMPFKTDPQNMTSLRPMVSNAVSQNTTRGQSDVQNSRFTVLMLVISAVFILSFMPYCILDIWRAVIGGHEEDALSMGGIVAFNFFIRSYFINSVINPFTYGFFNSKFRQFFFRAFCPCCRKMSFAITSSSDSWIFTSYIHEYFGVRRSCAAEN